MKFKKNFVLLFLIPLSSSLLAQEESLRFLALGDSYTAATGEKIENGWPFQLVQVLSKKNISLGKPKIIAGAGWTTTKLIEEIEVENLHEEYDLVGLMIGVNNQYRSLSVQEFEEDFELLLNKALSLSGNQSNKVFVISIPDWGVTPFARLNDKLKIAKEVKQFNEVIARKSKKNNITYIDVTKSSRNMGVQPNLIASDSLHPSAKMYKVWGKIIGKKLAKQL